MASRGSRGLAIGQEFSAGRVIRAWTAGTLAWALLAAFPQPGWAGVLDFPEHALSRRSGLVIVQGTAANRSAQTLRRMTITVKFYDGDGRFLSFERALVHERHLPPQGRTTFEAAAPDDGRITDYTIHADYDMEE